MFIRLSSVKRLSFTTLSVLHTLARTSPLRLTELTSTEQVTQSAMTQLVTRLEDDGLVRRGPDRRDGRGVLVTITADGRALVEARRASRVARLDQLLERLPSRERASIARAVPALRRLVEADAKDERARARW
jgi:DNA-binding MarR family transcriptional regulator